MRKVLALTFFVVLAFRPAFAQPGTPAAQMPPQLRDVGFVKSEPMLPPTLSSRTRWPHGTDSANTSAGPVVLAFGNGCPMLCLQPQQPRCTLACSENPARIQVVSVSIDRARRRHSRSTRKSKPQRAGSRRLRRLAFPYRTEPNIQRSRSCRLPLCGMDRRTSSNPAGVVIATLMGNCRDIFRHRIRPATAPRLLDASEGRIGSPLKRAMLTAITTIWRQANISRNADSAAREPQRFFSRMMILSDRRERRKALRHVDPPFRSHRRRHRSRCLYSSHRLWS